MPYIRSWVINCCEVCECVQGTKNCQEHAMDWTNIKQAVGKMEIIELLIQQSITLQAVSVVAENFSPMPASLQEESYLVDLSATRINTTLGISLMHHM